MVISFIISIILFVTYASSIEICDPDYIVFNQSLTRFQALQYCKQQGYDLVSYLRAVRIEEIIRLLIEHGQSGLFYWMDGISYWKHNSSKWWFDVNQKDMRIYNWCTDKNQPQEPNGTSTYGEPCLALNFRGDDFCWHDYPCFAELPFICSTTCTVIYPPLHAGELCVYTEEPKTAFEADEECQRKSYDHTLVIMNSRNKYDRIYHHLQEFGDGGQYYWSSLRRNPSDNNEWYWNSTRGFKANWTNWIPGQPDDPKEANCVVLRKLPNILDFDDRPCTEKHSYICE